MRSARSRLLVVLSFAVSLVVPGPSAAASGLEVTRVSGADRYETAVAVSRISWPEGADVAFVATGTNFADALTVAAAGGAIGPVLLTEPGRLPSTTAAELRRLGPEQIVVIGGTAAVSEQVRLAIARNATGPSVAVERVSGPDRYATAVEISKESDPNAELVYLTDGTSFTSGLVAAAAAGNRGAVLLTTAPTTLPQVVEAELARRRPRTLVVVGELAPAVVAAASRWAGEVRRVTARTPVDLAVAVSRDLWASTGDVLLASAADFPDALAAAAWSVAAEVPLLLTDPGALQDATACEVYRLEAQGAVITGGPAAVSRAVADALQEGISPFARGCEGSAVVPIPDPDPRTPELEVTLYEMTTSPDGARAYVVNNAWNSIEVVDLAKGTWLGRIAVGSDPTDLDLTPDGRTLYVMNNGSQTISVIDLTRPFDRAEVRQVAMLGAGTNSRRNYAIERSDDGNLFIMPARLSTADAAACLQVLRPDGRIEEVVPGFDRDVPKGPQQMFRSADGRLVGVIAPDGPSDTTTFVDCDEELSPEPSPSPSATPTPGTSPSPSPSPSEAPTVTEQTSQALFTYVNGTWTRVGAWGRGISDIAYGRYDGNGVTTDGQGTTTVFDATDRAIVLGTVTSDAGTSFGLAVEPLQPDCPRNRGNPAVCTQVAYNVVSGAEGVGMVEVLDVTEGLNVQGSFRVVDQFPLRTRVDNYGGQNQPQDAALQNQVTVTADATRLVVATEYAVEIFRIG